MLGALASICAFVFAALLGHAILSVLFPRRTQHAAWEPLQGILLAPATGFVALMLPTMWFNWAGLPVASFAVPLFCVLAVLAVVAIAFTRSAPPLRALPFLGVMILAFGLVGRPLFEFGFNWLSFSNEDMANYCLGAQRLIEHGFFAVPNQRAFVSDVDGSLPFYVLYVMGNIRTGVEELLGDFSVLLRVTPFQMFMPLIVAFQMMLIASTMALVLQGERRVGTALLAGVGIAVSALSTLGVAAQLIAQVCGIGFLVASLAPVPQFVAEPRWRSSVLLAILNAGTLVAYPEAFPFSVAALLAYTGYAALTRRVNLAQVAGLSTASFVLVLVLLNAYLRTSISTLALQVGHGAGASTAAITIFYFFLVPTGLADLFGVIPLGQGLTDPRVSLFIGLGIFLLLTYMLLIVVQVRDGEIVAILGAIMLALAPYLFVHRNDFGLFKLAMFIQPAIFGTFALAAWDVCRWAKRQLA